MQPSERLSDILIEFTNLHRALHSELNRTWPKIEPTYPPTLNQTLRFFVDVMMMRSRAVLILLVNDAYWDSEIVLRSLYEAFARCLTFSRSNDPSELLAEFWIEQLDGQDRRTARQAGMAAEIFRASVPESAIMKALEKPDWLSDRTKLNKAARRRLEQKWSFAELLNRLSEDSKQGSPFAFSTSLMHMYGMQSAISHNSARLYDLVWDRTLRGDDSAALEDGHYCRQMSDSAWMVACALQSSLEVLGVEKDDFLKPLHIAEKFQQRIAPHFDRFYESQTEFYEGLGQTYTEKPADQ